MSTPSPVIIPEEDDPLGLFHIWMRDAEREKMREPTAMAVATVDSGGRPHVRMLLLKGCDEKGFVFYTNLGSPKAKDLQANSRAALCFYWMPLGRQVRVEGEITPVTDEEADAYFATRPRLSQLGAWASRQSTPMAGRFTLEKEVARQALRFPIGKVPRPPWWSGFRLRPESMEFWAEKQFRHHERILYQRKEEGWTRQWLFP